MLLATARIKARRYNRAVKIQDFDYELPLELIAQQPAAQRAASRLLHLDAQGALHDRGFPELVEQVAPGDVLVFNDTRVIKARLHGRKASGGRIEVLVERVLDGGRVLAKMKASKSPKAGAQLELEPDVAAEVLGRQGEFYELKFTGCADAAAVYALLERAGKLPLPPYITHEAEAADATRYQTVYARVPGAVAAPTAGLHFDAAVLAALTARGATLAWVTLHVGAGTFQPVREDDIAAHHMHSERYVLPQATADAVARARAAGGRVIAVGTTSMRVLESCVDEAGALCAGEGETDIFIKPGHRFCAVDALVTNFHLPRSTLLMLVSAFAGMDNVRRAYRHAVDSRYRFFSYGDAMLLERPDQTGS